MNLEGFEKKIQGLGVLGVKVTQYGKDIAYKNWDEECRRNVYSASKSVTSCAVGFAVQEGLLSLSERLVDAFSQDLPETVGEHLEAATVRDLLTMCLGQENASLMGAQRPLYKERDWVEESTKKQVDNGAHGYGYLFWGGEQGTFRTDGKYGQLSILCRDKEAVISVVAECRDTAALNRAIFDELYPQL